MRKIRLTVNNKKHIVQVDVSDSLLNVLRNKLGLVGTKEGCGEGFCGVCTILLDGKAVNSCLILAVEADKREIVTIEGVAEVPKWKALQDRMVERGAVQCGFCSPGMILTALAAIENNPELSSEDLKRALAGNLCRCGTYPKSLEAMLSYQGELIKK